ncbi:hypothetical protein NQ317_019695 [Molorchus minor]|uniref:Uncharacterized protein n=1 Tax=Molorchus minor TaxID=1323400 RepID=A0ABQ9JRX7_9CUCU|nr:hypothetical protein NQ317_019695 [Molorchus minor]
MSCEVLNKIGTGDCERKTLHCKSDPSLAKILAIEERDDKRSKKVVGDIVDTITKSFNTMQIIEENTKHSEKEVCCTVSSKGVGDQLKANREVITAESPVRHPPVEKKNRLTDLLILNENKEVLESQPEEVIRVVELDSGDKSFKANRKILPENVPLPRNDSREILGNIDEKMDEIELFEPKERSGAGNGEDLF